MLESLTLMIALRIFGGGDVREAFGWGEAFGRAGQKKLMCECPRPVGPYRPFPPSPDRPFPRPPDRPFPPSHDRPFPRPPDRPSPQSPDR